MRGILALVAINACGEAQPGAPTAAGGVTYGFVSNFGGAPVGDVRVRIDNGLVQTTGPDGRFAVPDGSAPYDLAAALPSIGRGLVIRGLERRNPHIVMPTDSQAGESTANIAGTITAGGPILTATVRTEIWLEVRDYTGAHLAVGSLRSDGSYSWRITWEGTQPLPVRLNALRYTTDGSGNTTGYDAHVRDEELTLVDGAALTGHALAMQAIGVGALRGSVTVPSGYSPASATVIVTLGGNDTWFGAGPIAGPDFSLVTPAIEGATFDLRVTAASPNGPHGGQRIGNLDANASGIAINVPAGIEIDGPADGFMDAAGSTELIWLDNGSESYALQVDGGTYEVWVITRDRSELLPDLAALDLPLPAATVFEWRVGGFAAVPDDAATAPLGQYGIAGDQAWWTGSGTRTLTTAP